MMRITNFMKLSTLLLMLCLATQAQAAPLAGNIRVEPDFTSAVVTWTSREDVTVSSLRYYDPNLPGWITLEHGYTHEGTTWSITLTGLQESTEYDVQVMGMNEYGTGSTDGQGIEWTTSTKFKTKTPLNPPIITGGEPGTSQNNSYIVYWTADSLVDHCVVRYIKDSAGSDWLYPTTGTVLHEGTKWWVELEMLYPSATYKFYVKAQNTHEDVSTDWTGPFFFTMPGEDEPTNLKVEPTLTTAVVSWNVNLGAMSCDVRYRKIGETYFNKAEAEFYDAGKYGCTLTGLTSRTEYEVWVDAIYYDGYSSGWAQTTFTTPALKAPTFTHGEPGSSQNNSYNVYWTAEPYVDVCYARYRKTPNTEWTDARSGDIIHDGTNWYASFYMLYPGATYEVIAQARAVAAADAYSDWTEPFTFTVPGTAEPTNLKVEPTLTTAVVSWNVNSGAMNCNVRYREITENDWHEAEAVFYDTGKYGCTLDGLTSRTDYEVQVRANYYDGDASEWVTMTFTTPALKAPTFTGGEPGAYQNSYKVYWTAEPYVDVCYARYRKVPNTEWTDVRSGGIIHDGTNWYASFEMLTPGATYEVIAQARAVAASDAYSDWTEPYTFTMQGVAEPTNLKVVPDYTSAVVTWKANEGAITCEVQYRKASDTDWTDATCSWDNEWWHSTLTDLTPGTEYEVHVRATYYDGDASEWVTMPFTTLGSVTSVDDLQSGREVKSVIYYNMNGQASMTPFEGVNVVETRYTDGTRRMTKVIK